MQPYQVFLEEILRRFKGEKAYSDEINNAPVVHIDEVATLYTQDKREEVDIRTDFPNLAPPFGCFLLQYSLPERIVVKGQWQDASFARGTCCVVLVKYLKIDGVWESLFLYACVNVYTKKLFYTEMTMRMRVDCNGKIIEQGKDTFLMGVKGPPAFLEDASLHGLSTEWFHIPLLAISLMHCKNVVKVPAPPPPAPVVKQWERRGRPFLKEYTLDIHPMKRVLATEGGMAANGIKKALHICRGHFATYTDDNPLFGKVTGTFWKPMHTRGSSEIGEIKKDYRIKP